MSDSRAPSAEAGAESVPPGWVAPGDNILLYHDERSVYLTRFRPGGRFECHHGLTRFPDELQWGRVLLTNKERSMAVLRPSHGEVMLKLKRRTTVVYPKEAGRILMELGARSGGRYAECGSGSGAFASVLAAMVGDEGRVYSFERVAEHQEQAIKNLDRVGLSHRVEFALKDPVREGFGVTELDGIFIDVPEPWELVPAARAAIMGGAPWVSLSPTVDQCVRTERALYDHGFLRRSMVEISERGWKLFPGRMRPQDRMVGHTAFLVTAQKALDLDRLPSERPRR